MASAEKYILVCNAGSSSLKWAIYLTEGLKEIGRGAIERIGLPGSFTEWRLRGKVTVQTMPFSKHKAAVAYVVKALAWHKVNLRDLSAVGHRVVHGADKFTSLTRLTASVIRDLKKLSQLAPLHNPPALNVIDSLGKMLPGIKQYAVFDTAWFNRLPAEARAYALPLALTKRYQLRRYGFHGISHCFVAQEAARQLKQPLAQLNLITCHLGAGSSVTAVRGGRPIDTSMGFTPLEGLVMGTRAGDIDPGLVLHLLKQKGVTIKKLEQWLNTESGLKGVAGVSDMREVLMRAGYEVLGFKNQGQVNQEDSKQARLALKLFLFRLQKYISAYAGVLGKVDAIVFTGGIGERNEVVRNLTMRGLPMLKDVPVLVIPTNEELAIAREIIAL